jgi:hypothetical protein
MLDYTSKHITAHYIDVPVAFLSCHGRRQDFYYTMPPVAPWTYILLSIA